MPKTLEEMGEQEWMKHWGMMELTVSDVTAY
jgi:hypothetical protein